MTNQDKTVPQVVTLNEAYTRVEFRLEREGFDNVPALIRFYVGNRKPVSPVSLITKDPSSSMSPVFKGSISCL